jgi:hypothetical protein
MQEMSKETIASELFDEIVRQRKEIAELERERDVWKARAFAMFWQLPDEVQIGTIRKQSESAMAFIKNAHL